MRAATEILKAIQRELDWWAGFLFLLPTLLLTGDLIQTELDGYHPFLDAWIVGILTFGVGGRLGAALMRGRLRKRADRYSENATDKSV